MTYARARLWLGISGVGFFVTTSAVALWFDLAQRLLADRSSAKAIALTLCTFVLLSFPFDVLGGYLLPRRFHRSDVSLYGFLSAWIKGVVCQALVMFVCANLILYVAKKAGTLAATSVFLLLMLTLLATQLSVASLVGGLRKSNLLPPSPEPGSVQSRFRRILVYESSDPAFVGGLVGFPTRESLVLPAAWQKNLTAPTLSMQLTRRAAALATGGRTRGIALGLLWNLVGFLVASHAPRAGLTTAPLLIDTGLWLTLWSFLGLLLLPSLNRPGVHEADRFAAKEGLNRQAMASGISELDRLQDDEPDRSRWIERVFHPIPSVSSRLAVLDQTGPQTHTGAWQGARITLYLSWACLGFLARAVHCNVGRPELWVLFPGD